MQYDPQWTTHRPLLAPPPPPMLLLPLNQHLLLGPRYPKNALPNMVVLGTRVIYGMTSRPRKSVVVRRGVGISQQSRRSKVLNLWTTLLLRQLPPVLYQRLPRMPRKPMRRRMIPITPQCQTPQHDSYVCFTTLWHVVLFALVVSLGAPWGIAGNLRP
jgi:hypothetical protein